MQIIPIHTKQTYPVYLGQNILKEVYNISKEITRFQSVVLVSDDIVAPLYLKQVENSFPDSVSVYSFVIPHGESSKNETQLFRLIHFCAEHHITRTDLMIAIGGGVVGDLTGFCASIYLRGIPFINIPTTLLAQVDSSVGGKTAIDIPQGKNQVGTFYQPSAVICDTQTLSTLKEETFADGVAEIIKYGCIYDKQLFEQIPQIRQPKILTQIIKRCIEIKAEVVEQDELDKGLRMILNFGHTIGHAVEKYYHYDTYTHGQGVAIGMAVISRLGEKLGITEQGTTQRITKLLDAFHLPTTCDAPILKLAELSVHDKKNLNGSIHAILLKEIGTCQIQKFSWKEWTSLFSMLKTKIEFSPSKLSGTVRIPASKSILHRALLCAALSNGISTIHNISLSEDISATIDAIHNLGGTVKQENDSLIVSGIKQIAKTADINCRESGSTIRFLIPIAAALGIDAVFRGEGRLVSRPLSLYQKCLPEHGVTVTYDDELPFQESGKLMSGHYQIAGNVSSQFITGLLLALPLLPEDSMITVTPPFESKSYVSMTIQVLKAFGIEIKEEGYTYRINGNQRYQSCDYTVESDYSQAAFFLTANALGAEITLTTFSENSIQGDSAVLSVLKQAGICCHISNGKLNCDHIEPTPFEIDAADIPDLVPILCVLASRCPGTSAIHHVNRLKLKESDRIVSTMELIQGMGGTISYQDDSLIITGVSKLSGGQINSYHDHRIAMAAAIAASTADGKTILNDADCVKKSYPKFYKDYQMLGGTCNVIDLE